jgi:hypothetical protein
MADVLSCIAHQAGLNQTPEALAKIYLWKAPCEIKVLTVSAGWLSMADALSCIAHHAGLNQTPEALAKIYGTSCIAHPNDRFPVLEPDAGGPCKNVRYFLYCTPRRSVLGSHRPEALAKFTGRTIEPSSCHQRSFQALSMGNLWLMIPPPMSSSTTPFIT